VTAPVIASCPAAATVNCQDATSIAELGNATATDNCSAVAITHSDVSTQDANFSLAAHYNYTITRTFTATDVTGNFSTCVQLITVQDVTAPVITSCPAAATVNCQDATSIAELGNATATDNCSAVAITHSDVSTQDANVSLAAHYNYTITRTFTATDVTGNFSTCVQVITVQDVTAPSINCITNVSRNTNMNTCTYSASGSEFNLTTATDNCSPLAISYLLTGVTSGSGSNTLTGTAFNKGTTNVKWTVTDVSGNSSTCTFTVTVNDNQLPVITCPGNISVSYNQAQCGAIVTYSITSSDNCPGSVVTQIAGLPSGSTFVLGATTNTYRATDASGNTSQCSFTVTVTPAVTTSAVTVTPNIAQYSDKVTYTATIFGGASLCNGPNAAASVTFKVGTQTIGTVSMVPAGANLVGTLTNSPLLEPTPFGTAPTGQMSPGAKTVIATFNSINTNFNVPNNPTTTITINKEHARVFYTGVPIQATASSSASTTTVVLSANIMDIAVPQTPADPNYDGDGGDIRNAKVKFVNRDNNTDISGWITPTLVSSSDTRIGTVSYSWNVNLGSATDIETTVGIVVDNSYYLRNNPDDNTVVTVYKPTGDFITGGGYIMPTASVGTYASTSGTKTNFGFNVKYNKQGTNLQGNMNFIFRKLQSDNIVHVYQIKANSMVSLGVNISNSNAKTANYVAKANLKDITDPLAPVSLGGNLGFYVTMVDRGEPGSSDSISVALTSSYGLSPSVIANLLYSSNWVSSMTKQMGLTGGNIVVHSGFSMKVEEQPEEIIEVPSGMLSQNYPNPFTGTTTIAFMIPDGGHTKLEVYNSLGQLVSTLFNGEAEAGMTHKAEFTAADVPGGIYFYTLRSESINETRKMQLLK
jgi:hypothetical protein